MKKPRRIIPFFVPHQGCPHTCVFCNQKSISGSSHPPSGAEVAAKLREYRATIPAGFAVEAAFYGGSFTGLSAIEQETLLTPAYQACQEGLIDGIRISTRPDLINAAGLKRLKKWGVKTVELGAQSLDPGVLIAAGRGHTPEDTRRSARLIQDAGLKLGLQMMLGLPGDTRDKSLATGQGLGELRPDFVRIYPTIVMRGTILHKLYQAGSYRPLTLAEAIDWTEWLYIYFNCRGIPIVRLGLQTTDSLLKPGEMIAGPFHPAFGELVESAVALRQLEQLLAKWEAKIFASSVPWPKESELPEREICGAMAPDGKWRGVSPGQATSSVKPPAWKRSGAPLGQLIIVCNPRYLSRLIGQHRTNLHKIELKWRQSLKIIGDESMPLRDLWLMTETGTREIYSNWQEFITSCRIL